MGLTAAEPRRRAREDLLDHYLCPLGLLPAGYAATAPAAEAEATTALAAAAVTFGGPEEAERVTGIPANEFQSARRNVTAEKPAEAADAIYAAQAPPRRRARRTTTEADAPGGDAMAAHGEVPALPEQATKSGDRAAALHGETVRATGHTSTAGACLRSRANQPPDGGPAGGGDLAPGRAGVPRRGRRTRDRRRDVRHIPATPGSGTVAGF